MIVNSDNFNIFSKANLIKDKSIQLDNSLSDENIKKLLFYVLECESSNKDFNIKIILDKFSTKQIILVFRYFLEDSNFLQLRNLSFLTNILVFLRNYNSFDDSFFEDETIFINNIEQFLDVKLELKDILLDLKKRIFEAYISLCRSYSKQEYSVLDTYEDLPVFFYLVFMTSDLSTICSFFNELPEKMEVTIKKYKNAKVIINKLSEMSSFGNFLASSFLNSIQQEKPS